MIRTKIPEYRTENRKDKISNVLRKRQKDITVILENINDPHNMSACLRSCDAVGILKVHFLYHGTKAFPKLGNKSSASAKKWIETEMHYNVEDCFTKLKNEGFKVYTTKLTENSIPIYDLNLTEKVALVFGNEHTGVSEEAVNLADGNFLVPQVGMIQSLNISVACAVSVYEAFRQRYQKGLYDNPAFKETDLQNKTNEWLLK